MTPVGLELARPRAAAARRAPAVCVPKRDIGAPWAPVGAQGRPGGAPGCPRAPRDVAPKEMMHLFIPKLALVPVFTIPNRGA